MVNCQMLKRFSIFRELEEPHLKEFAKHMQHRVYPAGSIICAKGDKGGEMFFIQQGAVSVVLPLYRYDSQYKTIAQIGEGSFFGELSFFDGQERSADIYAETDVDLLILSRQNYDAVIKHNNREGCIIQQKIIGALVGIIREMNEVYSSAGFML